MLKHEVKGVELVVVLNRAKCVDVSQRLAWRTPEGVVKRPVLTSIGNPEYHLTEISTWKEANSGQAAPFDQQSQCPGTRVRFEEGHLEQRKV